MVIREETNAFEINDISFENDLKDKRDANKSIKRKLKSLRVEKFDVKSDPEIHPAQRRSMLEATNIAIKQYKDLIRHNEQLFEESMFRYLYCQSQKEMIIDGYQEALKFCRDICSGRVFDS